ncbi:hypothetical protein ACFSQT_32340 [Mesorhizobium calcicola]|uniref:Uncharacterized protein n=1 Tax=Mesorhizobium calcicola TaxID=1300310 RepID=A0ABW4WPT0_9HYPH
MPDADSLPQPRHLGAIAQAQAGRVHYTACVVRRRGFVLDDGTLFRLSPTRFGVFAGAASAGFLTARIGFDVTIEEEKERERQRRSPRLALQGRPTSFAVLRDAGARRRRQAEDNSTSPTSRHGGGTVNISRTGFTARSRLRTVRVAARQTLTELSCAHRLCD